MYYCPDVVRTIIADAPLWNEASTAAIANEFRLSPILRFEYLRVSNNSLWKIADSASLAIYFQAN